MLTDERREREDVRRKRIRRTSTALMYALSFRSLAQPSSGPCRLFTVVFRRSDILLPSRMFFKSVPSVDLSGNERENDAAECVIYFLFSLFDCFPSACALRFLVACLAFSSARSL